MTMFRWRFHLIAMNRERERYSSANDFLFHPDRSTNNNNPSTNFTKGSLIELANGDLRPVEDMRTEDFILSSNKNPELQMADTTVVKIAQGLQNNVSITFSYNGNTVSDFFVF